jgi:hypothetical protein
MRGKRRRENRREKRREGEGKEEKGIGEERG